MKKKICGFLLLFVFLAVRSDAQTMRCGSKVVSAGDSEMEVKLKCGEPAGKNSYTEEIVQFEKSDSDQDAKNNELKQKDAKTIRKTTVTTDEWTYDFGAGSLTRILKFRNGELIDIREAGYGSENAGKISRCDGAYPPEGTALSEIRLKCGEPSWTQSWKEEILEPVDENKSAVRTIIIDEWTYNFGPDRFIRIFKFRNGKLVESRTGGYGN